MVCALFKGYFEMLNVSAFASGWCWKQCKQSQRLYRGLFQDYTNRISLYFIWEQKDR